MVHDASKLVQALCDVTRERIVPLTTRGVSAGSKVFGAAILRKSDLSVVHCATNNETLSPLLHGEVNCLHEFFTTFDKATRPDTRDCLFFATHEPCSLCLSAITWSGFDNFAYLFSYEDTRDVFAIPYDIDILQQVFQVPPLGPDAAQATSTKALYNRKNKFWEAKSVADLLGEVKDEHERVRLEQVVKETKAMYGRLSDAYQQGKGNSSIPLA